LWPMAPDEPFEGKPARPSANVACADDRGVRDETDRGAQVGRRRVRAAGKSEGIDRGRKREPRPRGVVRWPGPVYDRRSLEFSRGQLTYLQRGRPVSKSAETSKGAMWFRRPEPDALGAVRPNVGERQEGDQRQQRKVEVGARAELEQAFVCQAGGRWAAGSGPLTDM
jgi:hypothetical protein